MTQSNPAAQAATLVAAYLLALAGGTAAFLQLTARQHTSCEARLAASGATPTTIRAVCGRPQ